MMKKSMLAAIAALGLLSSTTWAQVDLGGAISGAINQATGNTTAATQAAGQAGTQAAGQAGVQAGAQAAAQPGASGVAAGASANAAANGATNQTWLGRVGNNLRGAVQQAESGALRLQSNLDQSLQQYGLRPGDQLVDANGQPLTQAQFDQYLQSNPAQLRVLRNGQTVVINGNSQTNTQANTQGTGQGSSNANQNFNQGTVQAGGRQRLGISMNPSNDSVVVSGVIVGSPAAQAGLRPGDQIIAVNGQQVSNPNAMIQLVGSSNVGQALDVQFRRNGQEMQSQVMLANYATAQGQRPGAYQAGYASGMDAYHGAHGQSSGELNQRIAQLEQTVQQLRDEVRQLKGNNASNDTDANKQ